MADDQEQEQAQKGEQPEPTEEEATAGHGPDESGPEADEEAPPTPGG